MHVTLFAFYKQSVKKKGPPSFPGPPVVVMGRDLSARLMQLMFACAWGQHTHTHTHAALCSLPLSPVCHIPSLLHPTPSFPRSPTLYTLLYSSFFLHNVPPSILLMSSHDKIKKTNQNKGTNKTNNDALVNLSILFEVSAVCILLSHKPFIPAKDTNM